MLEFIIILSLASSFCMLMLNKWNYFEMVRARLHLDPCLICHAFWINVCLALIILLWQHQPIWYCLAYAGCATPITYYISVR